MCSEGYSSGLFVSVTSRKSNQATYKRVCITQWNVKVKEIRGDLPEATVIQLWLTCGQLSLLDT